jgi:hypothetical protein
MHSALVKENSSKFPGDAGFRWPPVQVVAAGEVSVERELEGLRTPKQRTVGRPASESGNRAQRNFAAAWPRRKPSVDRWGRGLRRFKTTPQRRRSLSLIERGVDRAGRFAAHFLPPLLKGRLGARLFGSTPLAGGFRLDVLSTPMHVVELGQGFDPRG